MATNIVHGVRRTTDGGVRPLTAAAIAELTFQRTVDETYNNILNELRPLVPLGARRAALCVLLRNIPRDVVRAILLKMESLDANQLILLDQKIRDYTELYGNLPDAVKTYVQNCTNSVEIKDINNFTAFVEAIKAYNEVVIATNNREGNSEFIKGGLQESLDKA